MSGFGVLARLMARRDRVVAPVCVLATAGYVLLTTSSFDGLYPTAAERAKFAATVVGNRTFEALYGPPRALDTLGGLVSWRIGSTLGVVVALMSMLIVIRHTRVEEESGRAELVRAGAVSRPAPLAAALGVVAALDLAIAVLAAVPLLAFGLPAAGCIALGASFGAVGLVFAAVGAAAAQVSEGARAARGIAGAVLGGAYLLRAAGDLGAGWLSWLSPIGWAKEVHAFSGERWWPLALCLLAAGAFAALAFWLQAHRDLGAGLLQTKPGPPVAARDLDGVLGLTFRLGRGALLAWTVGMFICGAVLGSVGDGVSDLVDSSQGVEDVLVRNGGDLVDAFFAAVLTLTALMATGYTISACLRLRGEETGGHAELLLSGPVARLRWAAGALTVALGGTALVLAATGLGAGLGYALAGGEASQIPRLTGAALVSLPAVWVIGALTVALYGLAPRALALAWVALAACVLVWLLGPLLDLPSWVLDASPYQHIPAVPAASLAAGPLLALLAVAAALLTAGLLGLRHRDIPT
jgi:polyether ionophore transport system permease protein